MCQTMADNDVIRFGLFMKKNGRPCQIILDGLDGQILTTVQKKVMDGGGIVRKKETADANGNLIIFSHKDAFSNQKATIDVFDYKYIEDCFEHNKILMNLMDLTDMISDWYDVSDPPMDIMDSSYCKKTDMRRAPGFSLSLRTFQL